jgi:hypothetical protein
MVLADHHRDIRTAHEIHPWCYDIVTHEINSRRIIGRHQELGSRSHADRRSGNIAAQENHKRYTVDLRNRQPRLKHNKTCALIFHLSDALRPYDSYDPATIHLYTEETLYNADLTTNMTLKGIYHGVCEAALATGSESSPFTLSLYWLLKIHRYDYTPTE